jgi:tetratricopeptide (TPR) repeat protein
MAKITKEEERQQNVAEAVSKTEQFFRKYSNLIYGCVIAVLVIALIVIAYNRFILQPKKAQAADQMAQAERWFEAGEYELSLTGDDNSLGFDDIISQYGSKAGQAVYLYAGIAKYRTGAFDEALALLKKYNGSDPILLGKAQACIGDTYVELGDLNNAVVWFEKAAKTTDNLFAAGYLIKAGIASEELGNNAKALELYKKVKDLYPNAPEAMEIDKYITRLEIAE